MRKLLGTLALVLGLSVAVAPLAACDDTGDNGGSSASVVLESTDLVLRPGEERKLNVQVDGTQEAPVWNTDDAKIAEVSSDGTVKAVAEGSAVVSVTAGGKSDFCQITVTSQGDVSVDDEEKVEGYLYYEDFDDRTSVPAYLRTSTASGGSITVENGEMTLATNGAGTAFASYLFDEMLTGKIVAEARVKVASTSFSNVLFFYRGDMGYSNDDIIACLGMDAGGFKNHNGSGWQGSFLSYSVDTWYEIRMELDIGEGKYGISINGTDYADQTFRKRGDGVEDCIRLLKFGTDKADAGLTYDYIRVYRESSVEITADKTTYTAVAGSEATVTLDYKVSGGASVTVTPSANAQQYATVGADNKTISFAADTPAGVYTFTVKAEDATGSAEQVFTVIVRADANTLLDTDFSELPAAMTLHEGNGSAEVVNGELQIKTPSGGGAVYARYDFGEALSGKVQAETRFKAASPDFVNLLFLYREGAQSIDASKCANSVAVQDGNLKYHNGSGWQTLAAASDNEWHDLRVLLDYDAGTISIWLDDVQVLDGGVMRAQSDDTSVLIVGSDKKNCSLTYDYLRFTKVTEATEE